MQVYKILPSILNPVMVRNTLAVYENLPDTVVWRSVGNLCQAAGNKWCKYKPIRLNSNINFADWWKGNDGNCGLQIPQYGTIDELFVAMRAGTAVWNYLKPRGIAYNEPYRLLDYAGYSVDSRPPIVRQVLNSNQFQDDQYIYVIVIGTTATSYELTLQDIGPTYSFDTMFFGVGISKKDTTISNYITTTTPIGNQAGASINLTFPSTLGEYDLVFFLCENQKATLLDPDPGNVFYPIPDPIQRITILDALSVLLTGSINVVDEEAHYSIEIQNYSSVLRTLNNCNIFFRYGDNSPLDSLEIGENVINLGTVNIQPNQTAILSGSIVGVGQDYPTRGGYLYFSNTTNSKYNTIRTI